MELDVSKMSPEEQATTEAADPVAFWKSVHEHSMNGISNIIEGFKKDSARCQEFYIGALATIINNGSQELAILRCIETGIRKQTLTEEQCQDALAALNGLRARIRAEAEQKFPPQQ